MRSIESRSVEIALGNGKLYILCRRWPSSVDFMLNYASIAELCRSVLEGCIMPENYASIWTGPQIGRQLNVAKATLQMGGRSQHGEMSLPVL